MVSSSWFRLTLAVHHGLHFADPHQHFCPDIKFPGLLWILRAGGEISLALNLGVQIFAGFERFHQLHFELGRFHEVQFLEPEHPC